MDITSRNKRDFFVAAMTGTNCLTVTISTNISTARWIRWLRPMALRKNDIVAPVAREQEVWAAGVTYYRSRDARMEESKSAGGGDFYDRVYSAERPELFFKATAQRVVGPNSKSGRSATDASWSVPEPELTLVITRSVKIVGYTIGNDMSSRDIEGENPLYLPQAKVYDRSCAIGPCILVSPGPLPPSTEIRLEILRGGKAEFSGSTALSALKRDPRNSWSTIFTAITRFRVVVCS